MMIAPVRDAARSDWAIVAVPLFELPGFLDDALSCYFDARREDFDILFHRENAGPQAEFFFSPHALECLENRTRATYSVRGYTPEPPGDCQALVNPRRGPEPGGF